MKKLLTEEDIRDIKEGKIQRSLTQDETVEYIDSLGTMTANELLEWGKAKIKELWDQKYGSI